MAPPRLRRKLSCVHVLALLLPVTKHTCCAPGIQQRAQIRLTSRKFLPQNTAFVSIAWTLSTRSRARLSMTPASSNLTLITKAPPQVLSGSVQLRSEEHTSELQSRG